MGTGTANIEKSKQKVNYYFYFSTGIMIQN